MPERKPFLLRLDPETFAAPKAWAADDLRRVLRDAGRLPGKGGGSRAVPDGLDEGGARRR